MCGIILEIFIGAREGFFLFISQLSIEHFFFKLKLLLDSNMMTLFTGVITDK